MPFEFFFFSQFASEINKLAIIGFRGFQLGDIYIGTPTCADDIALIESNKDNLQIMINVIGKYAKQHHYRIHPMKTKTMQYSTTNDDFI
jgi:hypothetical protein